MRESPRRPANRRLPPRCTRATTARGPRRRMQASAPQPTRNAGHASWTRSSLQPASAANAADGIAQGATARRPAVQPVDGRSGGVVTQPAANSTSAEAMRGGDAARAGRSPAVMGWFLLESLFALLVAVGIVWWTMGPRRKRKPPRRALMQHARHRQRERRNRRVERGAVVGDHLVGAAHRADGRREVASRSCTRSSRRASARAAARRRRAPSLPARDARRR